MINFLYLAINKEILINQTVYSVLSLYDEMIDDKCFKITIITNFDCTRFGRISNFENVAFDIIDDASLKEWKVDEYIYNVKIFALKYYLTKYKEDVLFIDSDTIILKKLGDVFNKINKNTCIMNFYYKPLIDYFDLEYHKDKRKKIDAIELKKTIDFFNSFKSSKYIAGDKRYPISKNFCYCNSGVIGIAYENLAMLDEVYTVSNLIWNRYGFVMSEEFAFSYVFEKQGLKIVEVTDSLIHYMSLKWVMYFCAYILDYYIGNDRHLIEKIFNKLKLDWSNEFSLNKQELPILISFLKKRLILDDFFLGFVDQKTELEYYIGYKKFLKFFCELNSAEIDEAFWQLDVLGE